MQCYTLGGTDGPWCSSRFPFPHLGLPKLLSWLGKVSPLQLGTLLKAWERWGSHRREMGQSGPGESGHPEGAPFVAKS